MKINLEITELQLKEIVLNHISEKLGELRVDEKDIHFLVKSKQNYKSEWEECSIVVTTRMVDYIPEIKAEVQIK